MGHDGRDGVVHVAAVVTGNRPHGALATRTRVWRPSAGSVSVFHLNAEAFLAAAPHAFPDPAMERRPRTQDTTSWLHRHGWNTHLHDIIDIATRYSRQIPDTSSGSFVIAVRDAQVWTTEQQSP